MIGGRTSANIECRDVSKSFPLTAHGFLRKWAGLRSDSESFEALHRITLHVPRGNFLGLLGGNGAGKSTLLRTLGGVYTPDSGTVIVPNDPSMIFEMGAFANIMITGRDAARRYLDINHPDIPDRTPVIDEIREFSELGDAFDKPLRTYSSGMRARLLFSIVMAIPAQVYLIDEFLSVGDEHFQLKSWARLRERLGRGATGIIATHDWPAILRLCQKALVLDHGQITFEASAEKAIAQYLEAPELNSDLAQLRHPEEYVTASDQDVSLSFDVVSHSPVVLQAALSIEWMNVGAGWEVVLLTDYFPVGEGPGTFTIQVDYPGIALRPGDYHVNLFLQTSLPSGEAEALDMRSWTTGNSIRMTSTGPELTNLARFPVTWEEVS